MYYQMWVPCLISRGGIGFKMATTLDILQDSHVDLLQDHAGILEHALAILSGLLAMVSLEFKTS